MKYRSFVVATMAVLMISSFALAHGNEQHVLGTVSQISNNSITVRTVKGQMITVEVTGKTEFTKSGNKVALSDLKVGERVVIHAEKNKDRLQAHTVMFGKVAPAAMKHESMSAHPHQ